MCPECNGPSFADFLCGDCARTMARKDRVEVCARRGGLHKWTPFSVAGGSRELCTECGQMKPVNPPQGIDRYCVLPDPRLSQATLVQLFTELARRGPPNAIESEELKRAGFEAVVEGDD